MGCLPKYVLLACFLAILGCTARSQACSINMDFEEGNFNYWQCYQGYVDSSGFIALVPGSSVRGRQTIIPATYPPATDRYGLFSLNSPNGSSFCVRLGNDKVDAEAERISYTFKVPEGDNSYDILYNYAVVLQNPPHLAYQQPRFTSRAFDLTKKKYIDCGSFDFAASSNLPGFRLANIAVNPTADVYYKPWSSAIINLANCPGDSIRLEFTTRDCALGAHFGYAYIDVFSNCNLPLINGNVVCNDADTLILTGPVGFAAYQWYTADFSTLISNSSADSLVLYPLPPDGTQYALITIPYDGLGCIDTAFNTLHTTSVRINFNVKDSIGGCVSNEIALSKALDSTNTAGLRYLFYTDSTISNPIPSNSRITSSTWYYIKAVNEAGCTAVKPVYLSIWPLPEFAVTDPPKRQRPAKADITKCIFDTAYSFTFWRNEAASQNLAQPNAVSNGGIYYIKATDLHGCASVKPVTVEINSLITVPTAFTPNGDGKNDVFHFIALGGVKELLYFKIFNRSGQLLFSTKTYGEGWDGKQHGQLQDAGTYIWVAKAVDWTGSVYEEKGSVVLIK